MYMRSTPHVSHQSGSLGEHPSSRSIEPRTEPLTQFLVRVAVLKTEGICTYEQKAIGSEGEKP